MDFFAHCDELPTGALALLHESAREAVSLGPDWYRLIEQTVFAQGPGHVEYAVLSERGLIICVFPMLVSKRFLGTAVKGLSCFYSPLFAPAMATDLTPALMAALLRALCDRHTKLASLNFGPMAPDGRAFKTLAAAMHISRLPSFQYFCFENWHVDLLTGWDQYIAGRSSQLRSTLRRKGRRFASAGGRFQLIERPEDIASALTAYEEVYARSWKKPEPFAHFVPGLLRVYAAKGELRLGLALLQGRPVAAQVWIVANGRAEIHKLAYDENHKSLSPGTLLTEFLMRHVLEQDRVKEVDYLIGGDRYKQLWMDRHRDRYGIVAYCPTTPGGMILLLRELLGRLTKGLRNRWRALRFGQLRRTDALSSSARPLD